MSDYGSVLRAAKLLSDQERAQLIDELSEGSVDLTVPYSEEWKSEIERRVAELNAGTVQTIPWSQIKNEALARIGNAQGN